MRCDHVVQLYDETVKHTLVDNVVRYLAGGLDGGEGALVIGTREHNAAFAAGLVAGGIDDETMRRTGRLTFLDAHETLARFLVHGQPDRKLFGATVGAAIDGARARAGGNPLRAYGEMVGVLWLAGEYAAAIRLEALWNELLRVAGDVQLFCAYPIDVLSEEFRADHVDALLCAHTHVVPAGTGLECSLDRALDEVLGPAATTSLMAAMSTGLDPAWAALPRAEAMLLWLRAHLPDYAGRIVDRARTRYRAA